MSLPSGRAGPVAAETRDLVRVGELLVDRAPVTNERYARFARETGHRPPAFWPNGRLPPSLARHPVVGVDFFDATAFALWAGGALPSELEWVQATGLPEPRAYVWGDEFDGSRCNTVSSGLRGTSEVDAHPGGTAPSGCVDMCGNVWELTCSPFPGDRESVVVKGGSWYDYPGHARLDVRFRSRVHRCSKTIGFRLVYGRRLRLPPFLDTRLVAECIAYRLAGAPPGSGAPLPPDQETTFLEDLREAAEQHLPDLEDDLPGVDALALDEALALFDAVEVPPSAARPTPPPRTSSPRRRDRPRLVIPAPVLALAAVAAALNILLLGWQGALKSPRPVRLVREGPAARQATRTPQPRSDPAPSAPRIAPPGPSRPGPSGEVVQSPKGGPLHDLLRGTPRQREEAERYFLWHPEAAAEMLERAAGMTVSDEARASLRYLRAAQEERVPGQASPPRVVHAPPRDGLVLFLDGIEGSAADELAVVRHTARAEGLHLTCVVPHQHDPWDFARHHAGVLGSVDLYADSDGRLALRWGVNGRPALVGLRPGGKPVFVHVGRMSRSRLARGVAALGRS